MNKRTRFLAGVMALAMPLRYSEIGCIVASAESYGSQTYRSENPLYHTIIALPSLRELWMSKDFSTLLMVRLSSTQTR